MTKVILNDALSVLRAELEADKTGLPIRGVILRQFEEPGIVIWVWDGPRNSASRRELYPAYKSKRVPASAPIQKGLELLRTLLRLTPSIQVREPNIEADDVIAHLAKQYSQHIPVEIRTRDRDLKALEALPNVTCTANEIEGIDPKWIHLYKATVGDPSDTVSGIPRFGDKSFKACDMKRLLACVSSDAARPAERWLDAGLSQKCADWAAANHDEIRACWRVTGFMPLQRELEQEVGSPNREAAMQILKEYDI